MIAIALEVEDGDMARWVAAAEHTGMSVSEWLTTCCNGLAGKYDGRDKYLDSQRPPRVCCALTYLHGKRIHSPTCTEWD